MNFKEGIPSWDLDDACF